VDAEEPQLVGKGARLVVDHLNVLRLRGWVV
jgi:hypothetical protein